MYFLKTPTYSKRFIISERFIIFQRAFIFFQSAFILFQSAFFKFSKCESALFIFFFQNIIQLLLYFLIMGFWLFWYFLNMFQYQH